MKNTPFFDLKRQYLVLSEELKKPMQEVIDACAFAGGPFTAQFEKEFAAYCNTAYAVGVNSGTSALHLAMLALNIGRDDEVILPANTFIATAWGPSYVGATPVFVDCDEFYGIDPSAVEAAITPRTKAVIGVHLYGQPCDIDPLIELAKKHDILFLEDAAQAHGARYKGRRVGGFGELACFSFYPGKNLGAFGEGGGLTTNIEAYRDHIFRLRNHGCDVRYYHQEVGFNMRMDGLQAAVLSVKLKYIDKWNDRRQVIAKKYLEQIDNEKIVLPKIRSTVESVFHLFVIKTEQREHFMKHCNRHGVGTALHYPVPCHLQKAYSHLDHKVGDFPNSEALANECVSLPMFAELTDAEVNHVIDVVNKY